MGPIKYIAAALLWLFIFTAGCEDATQAVSECTEHFDVLRQIPDTTIHIPEGLLTAESFEIDLLSGENPVFRNLGTDNYHIIPKSSDTEVAWVGMALSTITYRPTILNVNPGTPGTANITVFAEDYCDKKDLRVSFNVTVVGWW